MFRKHTFLLLIISFLTILAISCDMESLSDPDMMAFYGEWEIMEIRYVKEMDLRFALDLTKTTKDSGDFQFSAGMTIKI